jgi:uncharacterized membrane protein YphA (DoxX/SURF4 family)
MSGLGVRIYGLGAIALGLVGLAFADFALQWQAVPKTLPHHTAWAYASAAVLLLAGAALFVRRAAAWGAAVLTLNFAAWVGLHVPLVLARPGDFAGWLGLFEPLAITAGGLIAFARTARLNGKLAAGLTRAGALVFGLCLLVFGFSHVLYLDFTASMVPKWIPPGQTFWAWATGAAHVAAGLALLSGILARAAAWLVTLMFSSFVIVLHAPLVIANPHSHLNWCMLGVTLAIAGAGWIVAEATRGKKL